jgi:hypothetical protein
MTISPMLVLNVAYNGPFLSPLSAAMTFDANKKNAPASNSFLNISPSFLF